MGLQIGALNNPVAALVIAMLLCLFLGCAAVAYVAKQLVEPRPRQARDESWRRAA